MAICPRGHHSIADDFCDACGRPMGAPAPAEAAPELCPVCRTARNGEARYCEACGHEFGTRAAIAPTYDPHGYGYPPVTPLPVTEMPPGPQTGPQTGPQSGPPPGPPTGEQIDYGQHQYGPPGHVSARTTYHDPGQQHPSQQSYQQQPHQSQQSQRSEPSHASHPSQQSYQRPSQPQQQAQQQYSGYTPLDEPGYGAQPYTDDYGLGGGTIMGSEPIEPPPPPVPTGQRYMWTVMVTADPEYFQRVVSQGGPDAHAMRFPPYHEAWGVVMQGDRMRVGRRRVGESGSGVPEIDLSGPPSDPGISHLHVVLMSRPDGTWQLVDPGSTNGTTMNGGKQAIEVNTPVDLMDGDRVHVGAWTTLEIRLRPIQLP